MGECVNLLHLFGGSAQIKVCRSLLTVLIEIAEHVSRVVWGLISFLLDIQLGSRAYVPIQKLLSLGSHLLLDSFLLLSS